MDNANKYAELKKHILFMFECVEAEDQLEFWKELNESIGLILVDYLSKSSKPLEKYVVSEGRWDNVEAMYTGVYQYPNLFYEEESKSNTNRKLTISEVNGYE